MNADRLTLENLNALAPAAFVAALGNVFEHTPWAAEAAAEGRPYRTVAALHDAMMHAVRIAPLERQLALIGGHPELGSRVKRAELTSHSQAEQGELGLDRLSAEEFDRFARLNAAYRAKFNFPFIICVRRHTRDSILAQFQRRLGNGVDTERERALAEIGLITRLRLVGVVEGPGKPVTTGVLSTHVIDLTAGQPVAGIRLTLYEVGANARGLLRQAVTNAGGRTDTPLIEGEPLRIGSYELNFQVREYFGGAGFFDLVPIRFRVAEPEGRYHVPLLVTPWSYTTYRGS